MSTAVAGRVQAVERSIDILACLARGPQSLTDIVASTRLSKATAFRLLATLGYNGIVLKDSRTSTYMLGPGCLRLVDGVMAGLGAIAAAGRPALERLRNDSRETVQIHVRVSNQRVCIAEIPSPQAIRYSSTIGATAPLHVGSAGKILMAFADAPDLDRMVHHLDLQAVTSATITDLGVLMADIDATRRRGYAISHGERFEGASGISAPVRSGDLLAALSILGPTSRMDGPTIDRLAPMLIATASEVASVVRALDGGRSEAAGGYAPGAASARRAPADT